MTELQKKIFVAHNHINDMLLYRGINVEDLKTVSNLELSQMLEKRKNQSCYDTDLLLTSPFDLNRIHS